MEKTRLERWAELLLDTGKRNNLISFKDRFTSVAEVVYPEAGVIFDRAVNFNQKFEAVEFAEGEIAGAAIFAEGEKLAKQRYLSAFSSKVKRESQLLIFAGKENFSRTLKNIYKKAKTVMEETGVNIAYMAFGFINWKESAGGELLQAPLLLLPIVFENNAPGLNKKIEVLEAEITLNPSFVYKADRELGVVLPAYEGESFEQYVQKVEQTVQPIGWTVSRECKISTFSFLKINMYRDVEDNADIINANPNVKILLGEGASSPAVVPDADDGDLQCIVDADSSQEDAIRAVRSGKSIVLQGPPGTGKSQTITNIIAQCLADGRTVLFVSEKLAALNVVYEKLQKEGLDEFCLQLHSHKANKKDLVDELCKTLYGERFALSSRADGEIDVLKRSKGELNDYADLLHTPQSGINMSLYELIEGFLQNLSAPAVDYSVKNAGSLDESYFKDALACIGEYAEYTSHVGYDYRTSPWFGYNDPNSSYDKIKRVKDAVNALCKFIAKAQTIKESVEDSYGVKCDSVKHLELAGKLLKCVGSSSYLTPEIIKYPEGLLQSARGVLQAVNALGVIKNQICIYLKEEAVTALPGEDYYKKLRTEYRSFSTKILPGYNKLMKSIRSYKASKSKISYGIAVWLCQRISMAQKLQTQIDEALGRVGGFFGKETPRTSSDWCAAIKEIEGYLSVVAECKGTGCLSELTKEQFFALKGDMIADSELIAALFEKYNDDINYADCCFSTEIFDLRNAIILQFAKKIEGCRECEDELTEWCRMLCVLKRARELDLTPFIDAYLNGGSSIEHMEEAYKREFFRSYIEYVIGKSDKLSGFSRVRADKTVKTFCSKDKLAFSINKARIRAVVSSRKPDLSYVSPDSAVSMILHEGKKKRMIKSVRALLAEAGELIQVLKPCFLMSPLSVSTYLTGGKTQFDVVVFDEASQIFPQDAIGAIYRGKQIVVVGDSKQMPPSDFFMNTVTGEIDELDADDIVNDYESILDICSASFAEKRLKWHYRSRYESLIAFSNDNFYEGSLITFPSVKTDLADTGVEYYNVGGTYASNRTNAAEARAVADLVLEHFKKYPDKSLGVVAFNMAQQDAIEREINKRRAANSAFERFFSDEKDEYFFIKNLETVQGDERDTIIFSIAYGYNADGKFIHNFGPLNHTGGERRLNVAVTRARENIKLVCSICSADIDLNRSKSEGAKLLKAYIAYAERGGDAASAKGASLDGASALEREIAAVLTEAGYEVQRLIGYSAFKVELGVRSKDGKQFILAVECDGDNYKNARSARDRDRLRREILERMGWKYYRVWAIDWYKNKKMEKKLLLDAVAVAQSSYEAGGVRHMLNEIKRTVEGFSQQTIEEAANDFEPDDICPNDIELEGGVAFEGFKELVETDSEDDGLSDVSEQVLSEDIWSSDFSEEICTRSYGFSLYRVADLHALYGAYSYDFKKFAREVLNIEAPLSERFFQRRIAPLFGRSVVTTTFVSEFNLFMEGCESYGIIRRDGFMYLDGVTEYNLRTPVPGMRRSIDDISREEIASGLYTIIVNNVEISKDSLFKTLAHMLGFTKLTAVICVRMEQSLLLIADKISVDGTHIKKI